MGGDSRTRQGPPAPRRGQPVVALDFDGVINAICEPGREPPGFERHKVWLDAATWPDHEWIAQLLFEGGDHTSLVLNPVHGRFVHELIDAGVLVVWATAWQRAVLPHASLAGLPELPVLPFSELTSGQRHRSAMEWKPAGFAATFDAATPLLFVDDSAWAHRSMTIGPHGGPFKVVVPNERCGMTRRDRSVITNWAQAHVANWEASAGEEANDRRVCY